MRFSYFLTALFVAMLAITAIPAEAHEYSSWFEEGAIVGGKPTLDVWLQTSYDVGFVTLSFEIQYEGEAPEVPDLWFFSSHTVSTALIHRGGGTHNINIVLRINEPDGFKKGMIGSIVLTEQLRIKEIVWYVNTHLMGMELKIKHYYPGSTTVAPSTWGQIKSQFKQS